VKINVPLSAYINCQTTQRNSITFHIGNTHWVDLIFALVVFDKKKKLYSIMLLHKLPQNFFKKKTSYITQNVDPINTCN
jgi:hypothetical protein